jgi:hypothetical protein
MVCGTLSSVMVKSFAVRPSMALPLLSFHVHSLDHERRGSAELGDFASGLVTALLRRRLRWRLAARKSAVSMQGRPQASGSFASH